MSCLTKAHLYLPPPHSLSLYMDIAGGGGGGGIWLPSWLEDETDLGAKLKEIRRRIGNAFILPVKKYLKPKLWFSTH